MTPVVAVAFVVMTHSQTADPTDAAYEPVDRGQVSGRIVGDPDATVRIVMIEDFQCPF